MRSSNGDQGRHTSENVVPVCKGMARVQSAHAVSKDVYAIPRSPLVEELFDFFGKLVASQSNGADWIDLRFKHGVTLKVKMFSDTVEIMYRGERRQQRGTKIAKSEKPVRQNDGSHAETSLLGVTTHR